MIIPRGNLPPLHRLTFSQRAGCACVFCSRVLARDARRVALLADHWGGGRLTCEVWACAPPCDRAPDRWPAPAPQVCTEHTSTSGKPIVIRMTEVYRRASDSDFECPLCVLDHRPHIEVHPADGDADGPSRLA